MNYSCFSITDELETVCGLLSPPRTPSLLSPPHADQASPLRRRTRHASEMSNPEMALYLEKEHLRDAEDSDYHLINDIIQRRFHVDHEIDERFDNNAFFLTVSDETSEYRNSLQGRSLRRSSAIEVKDLPTPMAGPSQALTVQAAPVALPEPESPGEVFDAEPNLNEPPIVPVQRAYPGDSFDSEPKPTIIRKLSRQESQGKVGRQNTLAIDMARQNTVSASLPPPPEEHGSQDSLIMPTETMC